MKREIGKASFQNVFYLCIASFIVVGFGLSYFFLISLLTLFLLLVIFLIVCFFACVITLCTYVIVDCIAKFIAMHAIPI